MLKRDITATFAGNVVATILSLGSAVIIARVLGPDGQGLLALAILIPTITSTFARLGQETVNATFAGLYKDNRDSLFIQSLIFTIFGGVVGVLVICVFFFWLPIPKGGFSQLSEQIVWLTMLIAPVSIFAMLIISLVRGVGKIGTAAMLQVVQTGTTLVLLVIFLVGLGRGLVTAVWITALAPLPAGILAVWVLCREISFRPGKFSGWLFKKSLRFGSALSLATFASFLVYRLDQGMLGYMVPLEQLGLYAVAVGLAEQLKILPRSISAAFLPRLASELKSRQRQVPQVFRCTVIVSVISMGLVAVLGAPAVLVFFGWEYTGSILPFLILLPGVAVLGGASILSSDLLAREKAGYSVWISYSVLGANIGLNLLFIPLMGIMGAALASTISYVVACGLWMVLYRKESGTPLRELIARWKDCMYVLVGVTSMAKQVMQGVCGKGPDTNIPTEPGKY